MCQSNYNPRTVLLNSRQRKLTCGNGSLSQCKPGLAHAFVTNDSLIQYQRMIDPKALNLEKNDPRANLKVIQSLLFKPLSIRTLP